jgi:hypothetical protein
MKRKFKQFHPYQYNYNNLYKIDTAYDVGIQGAGLGQTQNVTGLKRLTGSQPQLSDNLMSY